MTANRLGTGDSFQAGEGYFQHWRCHSDRRFWWSMVVLSLLGSPMARCVMDDFGDLVRVSEVV